MPDASDKPPLSSKRILVVEDEKFLRELYYDILSGEGFTVDQAADGEEGYRMMSQGGYDVVLLDIMLPKMDGLSILEKLSMNAPVKPNGAVVILSNLEQDAAIAKAVTMGARGYMIKSDHTPDQLIAKVKSYMIA